ncbi:hypothetical protein ACFOY8_12910 [Thalassospira xianhensis]|nr:hypothetical protein [Thalassospira xianhensis]
MNKIGLVPFSLVVENINLNHPFTTLPEGSRMAIYTIDPAQTSGDDLIDRYVFVPGVFQYSAFEKPRLVIKANPKSVMTVSANLVIANGVASPGEKEPDVNAQKTSLVQLRNVAIACDTVKEACDILNRSVTTQRELMRRHRQIAQEIERDFKASIEDVKKDAVPLGGPSGPKP